MEQRFHYLLQKFLTRNLSQAEEDEFSKLILTGDFEDEIRKSVADFMHQDSSYFEQLESPISADDLLETIRHKTLQPETERISRWKWWTQVAAAIALAATLGIWFFPRSNTSISASVASATTEETPEDSMIVIRKRDYVRLPDGSTVLLNEDSELTYQWPFDGKIREVILKGEAFFEVTRDKSRPFIVKTGKISTKVLGTAFNVNAKNENVIITVENGLVEVADETRNLSLVRPNEQLAVNPENGNFRKKEVAVKEEVKWKRSSLVFDNISFSEVAAQLEEHFDVKLSFTDTQLQNCRISAWFLNEESLEDILDMVCGTRQANYSVRDQTVTISGGIPCD